MKSVLLVEAPFYAFFKYDFWNYAFSCSYLAGILKQAGHKAYIYDADKYFEKDLATRQRLVMIERQEEARQELYNYDNPIWKHFASTIADLKPDCIIFSTWTFKNHSIRNAITIAKDTLPQCKIAVGGYHVTALPNSFDDMPQVNGVLIGPAENTLIQWINDNCPSKKYIEQPTSSVLKMHITPDRDAFLYKEHFLDTAFCMTVLSRGCYSNCSFCCNELLTARRHVFATDDFINKEICTIKEVYNQNNLSFADAHFFTSKNMIRMLNMIKRYDITWTCALRVDSLTPEFVDLLVESGCNAVFCGLERGRNDLLQNINKKITLDQIRYASDLLTSRGIALTCSFVVGFPDEDE